MINKSKFCVIAAVAAITFASPAFAEAIPGYAPDGSVIALGHDSNAWQKSDKLVIRQRRLYDSFAAPDSAAFGSATPSGYDPSAATQR